MLKKFCLFFCVCALCAIGLNSGNLKASNGDVKIDNQSFPDSNVRNSVKKSADKNKDGLLSYKERQNCECLYLEGTNINPIKDLKGIELFPNVVYICLTDIKGVESKDFASLHKLNSIAIDNCQDENLDLSNLVNLKALSIDDQFQDSTTKKKGCIKRVVFPCKLEELVLHCSELSQLNIANLTKLKVFYFGGYDKINLDFSHCKDLREFDCDDATNKVLDLTHNKKIEYIDLCGWKNLTRIKLPKTSGKAKELQCKIIACEKLNRCNFNDARNITCIEMASCNFSKFSASKLSRLSYLDIEYCKKMKTISVLRNKNLHYIFTNGCPIKKLVLWKNKKLIRVGCRDSKKLKLLYLPKGKKVEVHKYKKTKIKRVR